MDNPVEIEKRFYVLEDLKDFLVSKKFTSSKVISDEYLDTPDGLFYQDGIYIRVRNGKSLDFKFNPEHLGSHNVEYGASCHEYNIELPFESSTISIIETLQKIISIKCPHPYTFEEFLRANNLQSLMVLQKIRDIYEDETFIVAVDKFSDLGTFVEFEAKKFMSSDSFFKELVAITKGLHLKPLNSGYFELRLREINESLYLKGKYLIDEEEKVVA
ncbi:MAG: CYTH domain-containing protein [Pseudomonadota bacterium]|jgi:adenylate cyclase class IV|nr:CYTH domain-containing protein [Alphaproteobacteria bacterium]